MMFTFYMSLVFIWSQTIMLWFEGIVEDATPRTFMNNGSFVQETADHFSNLLTLGDPMLFYLALIH